ncbi:M56 family metallopeptidase [Balneolaceae bacterium YR4-1]|uniref:M56 family metallopeptidase n=1 Tax=Halalkalibaculum roseum TaxID=2709311 RepID=A0A6M1T6F0_9BACT|nr:M56 family metallopeptidase [Halalkalibaculum roseum]NGP75873.1 M56 family metallopeptidase [Halalkalibaculum roseum]
MDIINTLQNLGSTGFDLLLLPIVLWTAMSLLALAMMRYSENLNAIFRYHGHIALILALPIGLLAALMNHWLHTFGETAGSFATKFIVIQNPIVIPAAAKMQETSFYMDPAFWGGAAILALGTVALILLLKLAADFISLSIFAKSTPKRPIESILELSTSNTRICKKLSLPVYLSFSDSVDVPFTYGWKKPVIVIPDHLKDQSSEKLNLAIRHELMHIRHHDYALNAVLMTIKALFWFHPIIHKLYAGFKEYREISCDSEVLSDDTISRKSYAQLLFELAGKQTFSKTPAVSMAVPTSTLKKRIQIMSNQNHKHTMFKTSFYITLFSALFMTGIMACTDIQDSGIRNSDIENAQAKISASQDGMSPLYVLDGEIIEDEVTRNKLSAVKTKYIESLNVLKGEKAIEEYGPKAQNGVIEFKLLDRETAFNDLKAPPAPGTKTESSSAKDDHFVVVEQMPELKGGMQSLMSNITYPEEARKAGIEGRVIVQFIVNKEGQVENPQIIKGIGGGADEEALRVVKEAEFTPGYQKGQPVRVQYSLPVVFKLQKDDA